MNENINTKKQYLFRYKNKNNKTKKNTINKTIIE